MNSEGPEVYHPPHHDAQGAFSPSNAPKYEQPATAADAPKIWGLRPSRFWTLIVILVIIVATAVGGGVGGGLAAAAHSKKSGTR